MLVRRQICKSFYLHSFIHCKPAAESHTKGQRRTLNLGQVGPPAKVKVLLVPSNNEDSRNTHTHTYIHMQNGNEIGCALYLRGESHIWVPLLSAFGLPHATLSPV